MSKKQEIGGLSEKGRLVYITVNHILWTAKKIDGTLVVEKFIPGKISEHELYVECCPKQHFNGRVKKVFIPKDVEYFMNEISSLPEFLCRCNTFAHMALVRQICTEFAKIIVKAEDKAEYERLNKHCELAEAARKEAEEKSKHCTYGFTPK